MFIYPLLFALRLLIVRNNLYVKPGLKLNKGRASYVIYANHQSRLDPFIICGSFSLANIRKLIPLRFFVDNSYFKGPARIFLGSTGCFPAHYDPKKPYGLERAKELMALNQTVVIFPPGRRTREHIAKSGISVLATEPAAQLIPIYINWKTRWTCEVSIGGAFKGGKALPAEHHMRRVYELSSQTS